MNKLETEKQAAWVIVFDELSKGDVSINHLGFTSGFEVGFDAGVICAKKEIIEAVKILRTTVEWDENPVQSTDIYNEVISAIEIVTKYQPDGGEGE